MKVRKPGQLAQVLGGAPEVEEEKSGGNMERMVGSPRERLEWAQYGPSPSLLGDDRGERGLAVARVREAGVRGAVADRAGFLLPRCSGW